MERTYLETLQLLGLDVVVVLCLVALAVETLVDLARQALRRLTLRRECATPTAPLDAWSTQEWRSSH